MIFSKFHKLGKNNFYIKAKKRKKVRSIFQKDKYWDLLNHRDPDGKKRNLSNERDKKLNDLRNEINFIKYKFKNKNKIKLIDLGSGFGYFLSAFPNHWNKVGIEISKSLNKYSDKYGKIFNYDLEKKLPNLGKFDLIFSYHVIEHLSKPEKLIDNIKGLCKRNSIIIIGTPNFDSGCARLFGKNYRMFHDKTHISLFSDFSMYRMLDKMGFKILHIDYPYFQTEHFNVKNFLRLKDKRKKSPPFYGNIMTFYMKLK